MISCGEKVDCRHCGGTGDACGYYCNLHYNKCDTYTWNCGLCLGLGYNRE